MSATAVGGPGGAGGPPFTGGALPGTGGIGAFVIVPDLGVSGHSILYVEVGGAGGPGQTGPTAPGCFGGPGGSNGGGVGGQGRCTLGGGGGGGGASDVRTSPAATSGLTGGAGDPRLLVAGGGGGGGGAVFGNRNGGAGGAAGGSAATGAGAGGSEDCSSSVALGAAGAIGQTGPPAGAGGTMINPTFCFFPGQTGGDGAVPTGGTGGDGNTGNTAGGGGGGGGYYGGGGGVALIPRGGSGGGGGSSFGPSGSTFQTASVSQPPEILISWTESASVSISAPANGQVFSHGQAVTSSFTCSDLGGPGISSCTDQNGKSSGAAVDTSTPGQHTFTVTAASSDGLTSSSSTSYTVVATPLQNVTPPAITGKAAAGKRISCSTGTWTNAPTSYAYQWSRNGTPLAGATASSYAIQKLDEGSTLTCTVTATNPDGSASATSSSVRVPIVLKCPAATGRLSGQRLGAIRLDMTRKRARSGFSHRSSRGRRYLDFFCLTPIGVRAGYASPELIRALPPGERDRFRGRVVWISTSNPRYAINGVRAGAALAWARHRLRLDRVLAIGVNDWYFAPAWRATALLKVRDGVVIEVGIVPRELTADRRAQLIFMTSFE